MSIFSSLFDEKPPTAAVVQQWLRYNSTAAAGDRKVLYRVERPLNETNAWQTPYCQEFLVLRRTPKGFKITDPTDLTRERFVQECATPAFVYDSVNLSLEKRFAYETIEQALVSFLIRQQWRVLHAERTAKCAKNNVDTVTAMLEHVKDAKSP